MKKLHQWLNAIFHRRRLEQDLQDELSSHLDMDEQERIQRGESPEEAHYNARRDFGNLLRPAENARESWGTAGIDRLLQDVTYAFRQMQRNPGFAAVAILTLGIGIGATTAIFSIVNAVLIRPLPYKNSDRLVRIVENIPAAESLSGAPERTTGMSPETFLEWRSKTKTLSGMAMERQVSKTLPGHDAVRLSGLQVSPALFPMFGVQPVLGRVFEPNEEKPGFDKIIILSFGAWQRLFGGDPQIIDKALILDDAAYTVVGIMPREFIYPDSQTDFWTPLALPLPGLLGLPVIARLKDNVPISAATEEAAAIGRYLRGESPNDPLPPGPPRIQLMTVKEELVAPIRLPLLVFVIAVSFVLLVACINVASLFLARATTRNREIAIRVALGASRARVLRQLLTENFILAFLGGPVGVVLAFAGTRVFTAAGQSLARTDLMRFDLAGNAIPRLNEINMDASVLLFTIALTVVTGILFGGVPALQIGRINPIQTADLHLAGSSRWTFQFLRTAMVIGQISLTMILLLGAGLLIKSFVKLANTNVGYDPSNVLTFKIPQPDLNYPQDELKQKQQNAFAEEVVTRLASVPGIQAAAFTDSLPMVQGFFSWDGPQRTAATPKHEGRMAAVSRDYFRAMGIRVIAGRGFNVDDGVATRAAYVINRAAVREYFSGLNAVGKTISGGGGFFAGEVVGIVDDIRQSGLDAGPVPQLYMDPKHMNAVYGKGYYFAVRTPKEAAAIVPAIRAVVRDIDPQVVVDNIATMNQILSNSITTPRSYAVLLGTFSATALILATIGLYGVLSYFVTQRTREIGIRIAVGAQRSQLLLLVMRQGLVFGIVGVMLGIVGGMALTRYLEKMLFGVTAADPGTFVVVAIVFISVTLVASYIPAQRATRVDPLAALRYE